MPMSEGDFVWYELMTSDVEGAQAFYAKVVGWSMAESGLPGMRYTLAKVGERQVGPLQGGETRHLDRDGVGARSEIRNREGARLDADDVAAKESARDTMVALLNRRSYIRNLVRDVNEALG